MVGINLGPGQGTPVSRENVFGQGHQQANIGAGGQGNFSEIFGRMLKSFRQPSAPRPIAANRVGSAGLARVAAPSSGVAPDYTTGELINILKNKVIEIGGQQFQIHKKFTIGERVDLPYFYDASGKKVIVTLNAPSTANKDVDTTILMFWERVECRQRQNFAIQIYTALEQCRSDSPDLPRLQLLAKNYLDATTIDSPTESDHILLPAYRNGSFVGLERIYFNDNFGHEYLQWYLSKPNCGPETYLQTIVSYNVAKMSRDMESQLIGLQGAENPVVNLYHLSHEQGASVPVARFDANKWIDSYSAYVRNGFNIMQEQAKHPDSYSLNALAADYMASYFKIFLVTPTTNPTLGGVVLRSSWSGIVADSELEKLYSALKDGGYIDNFFITPMEKRYNLSCWINFQKVSNLQNFSQLNLSGYTDTQKEKIFGILKQHLGLPGVVPPTTTAPSLESTLALENYLLAAVIKDREIQVREALIRGDQRITLPGQFTQDGKPIIQDRRNIEGEFRPGVEYGYFHRQANLSAVYAVIYDAFKNPGNYPYLPHGSLVQLLGEVDKVIENSEKQFSTYVVNFTDPEKNRQGKGTISFSIADPNCAQHITNYLKSGTPPPIENTKEMKDSMVVVRDSLNQFLTFFPGSFGWDPTSQQPRIRNVQVPFSATTANGPLKVIFAGNTPNPQQDRKDWEYVQNTWKPAQEKRIHMAQLILDKLNQTPKSYEEANILREIVEAICGGLTAGRITLPTYLVPGRLVVPSQEINFSDAGVSEGIRVLTDYLSRL